MAECDSASLLSSSLRIGARMSPAPRPRRLKKRLAKPSLVEQAKETLEDWQAKIDERVRAVVPSLLPWQQLELEVKRLEARVAELESKLRARGDHD